MEIVQVSESAIAYLRPEEGANAGLVRTADGLVVVDTTSCAADMQELLEASGATPGQVRLVINTHSHSDHTWGNQLFGCPILAHRLCAERMRANLGGAWQMEALQASIAERGASDPDWAREMRQKLVGLRITLPTETFEERRDLEIGGVRLQVIHVDAHSPGSSVVWLPEEGVFYAGDLVFQGRYPYIGDADLPELIAALKRLPDFGARAIVPGHGLLCDEAEIAALRDYLEGTWARTIDHLAQGHSVEEAIADPGYPRYAEKAAERYHEANIRLVFAQLGGDQACPL
jgi:cyclase